MGGWGEKRSETGNVHVGELGQPDLVQLVQEVEECATVDHRERAPARRRDRINPGERVGCRERQRRVLQQCTPSMPPNTTTLDSTD